MLQVHLANICAQPIHPSRHATPSQYNFRSLRVFPSALVVEVIHKRALFCTII